jgi:SAM-dependent methyltransferase
MGQGFNEVTYHLRLAAVEQILGREAFSPRTVFEGAVGVGAYAPLWRKLGVERWAGVDLSAAAVERLSHRFPDATFAKFDLSSGVEEIRGAFGSALFDLVTGIDVLYHIVDDSDFAQALSTLGKMVTPSGRLLISDVFVREPTTIAPHVRRRPLVRYQELLASQDFLLVQREPVFAVLGDPVPRQGIWPFDLAMLMTWRVLSKAVRSVPMISRDAFGRFAAKVLTPVDSALRHLGRARGVNLELALFRRRSHASARTAP